jgi:hypothetical protein
MMTVWMQFLSVLRCRVPTHTLRMEEALAVSVHSYRESVCFMEKFTKVSSLAHANLCIRMTVQRRKALLIRVFLKHYSGQLV